MEHHWFPNDIAITMHLTGEVGTISVLALYSKSRNFWAAPRMCNRNAF